MVRRTIMVRFGSTMKRKVAGAVVEIDRIGDELDASLFDEGRFERGGADGKLQLLQGDVFCRIAIGESVPEDSSCHVACHRRKTRILLCVKPLSKGGSSPATAATSDLPQAILALAEFDVYPCGWPQMQDPCDVCGANRRPAAACARVDDRAARAAATYRVCAERC